MVFLDPEKTHAENVNAFLEDLEVKNLPYAAILREHLTTLTADVCDDASRRNARDNFNRLVKQRLDELIDSDGDG